MKNIMRRFGIPFFSTNRKIKSNRPTTSPTLRNELLEKRELLAADLGMADPAMAIFHALSRGGDAMMASMGATQTSTLTVDASINSGSAVAAATSPQSTVTAEAFEEERVEAAAVAAVARAAEPITTSTASQDAEGAPSGDLIELPVGLDYPDGQNISLTYNPVDGELAVAVYSPTNGDDLTDTDVGTLQIISAGELFAGTPQNLTTSDNGGFDVFRPDELFKVSFDGYGSLSFGQVLPTGLTEQELYEDLTVTGSPTPSIGGILSDADVELDLRITSIEGSSISEIQTGQEFILSAFVEDISSGPLNVAADPGNGIEEQLNGGVFAAYIDVIYDSDLAEPVGAIEFGDDYSSSTSGALSPGLIDEVGGSASSLDELGRDARELFSIRMRATGGGALEFTTDPADQLPAGEVLVYNKDAAIDPLRMHQDTATLTIVAPDDLAAFAQALADSGAFMYGAGWCPACTAQKEAFGDGQEFLPFVEVTNPDRSRNAIGDANNIDVYPTWILGDGTRLEGSQTIEELVTASGIAVPQSADPIIIGLEDQTLLVDSPLHVPLDGYDPNDTVLTYEVTSSNPDVGVELTSGNRSLLLDINGYGNMLFELFDDKAPRATDRIAGLADDGFYDGLDFHRIIDGFMIQGGQNPGNVPDQFDDQFHVDLQHNQSGILSLAKAGDDTNTSQFFITDAATRHLDGNHSVFGQLIEGDKNRDSINNTATGAGDVPTNTISIQSATVIDDDTENGLVLLRALNGATSGTSDITVTVRDPDGNSTSETFTVTLAVDDDDNANTPAWLEDFDDELTVGANSTLEFTVQTEDVEGDTPTLSIVDATGGTATIDAAGLVTVTPTADSLDDIVFTVRSSSADIGPFQDPDDNQVVTVDVLPATPILNLAAGSDSGAFDDDDITNADTLDFGVSQLNGTETATATVKLFIDEGNGTRTEIGELTDSEVAAAVISTDAGTLLDDGVYSIVAQQTIDGESSDFSDPVVVTILRDAGAFTSTAPTDAIAADLLTYDAENDAEGDSGFTYSLVDEPTGAVIDPDTGELTWTPTYAQDGNHAFTIRGTDVAGNTVDQAVSIDVVTPILAEITLELTDTSGSVIEASRTATDFLLNVYVEDQRKVSESDFGVMAAYIDIAYDETLVSVTGAITYGTDFPDNQTGDTATTAGLIDEAGASTTTSTGSDRVLLMSIPMQTDALGTATFTSSLGSSNPFALLGHTPTIATDTVELVVDELAIVNTLFAQDDTFNIDEDSPVQTFNVLTNDLPGDDSGTLTITGVTNNEEAKGTVTFTGTEISYTPAANFSGTHVFDYEINDGNTTSTATVTVNIAAVDDAPVAVDDDIALIEDSVDFTLDVLDNDTDDDGDDLTITSIDTDPANGTATIASDGKSIVFNPAADFNGSDTLTYSITDGVSTAQATVNITVAEENDPPVADDDAFSTEEDTPLTILFSELLSNDAAGPTNEDGQAIEVSAFSPTIENGTLAPSSDTGILFTPNENFNGTVTFEYTVTDQGLSSTGVEPKSDTATVTITVNSVNDIPVAVDDAASTRTSAGSILIDVLANDSDADTDDTLTITDPGTPSNGGTVSVSDGQISYTPASDFSGTETFTYTVTDDAGATAEATVSVEVESFVQGGLGGYVQSGNNRGLTGVSITLTGNDDGGNPVELTTRTNADGSFDFSEVRPGTYTIRQVPMPFMVDGTDSIEGGSTGTAGDDSFTVTVTADGVGNQEFAFVEQGLNPRFAIWEALASAGRSGVYVAVEPGQSHVWAQTLSGWDDMTITDITLSANGNTLTITANDSSGTAMEARVAASDKTKVRSIGKEGNVELIRLVGTAASFNFTEVATSGEGENPVDAVFASGF